jgi:phospholipase C
MKSSRKFVVFAAAALAATAAHAQYGKTPIQHVIVIFQENRTPDNLFQALCTANGGVPGCTQAARMGPITSPRLT